MIAWRIALRYLFSKKSHSAVNIISIVSVAGVAVATAAIVIVLSVFNGFVDLASSQLTLVDPDLKVLPIKGKTLAEADSLAQTVAKIDGVRYAVPVVEERALAISGNMQMPVVMKGVPTSYDSIIDLDKVIVDGAFAEEYLDFPAIQTGVGVAVKLGVRPAMLSTIGLYVPRRVGRINPANPAASFRGEELMLTGVAQTNQQEYDNENVMVPLSVARNLLEYDNEASAIEVRLEPDANVDQMVQTVKETVNKAYAADSAFAGVKVLTRAMQEEKSFRMIMIEKWVTFLMLAFILVIASFNIISTLSLLVIEKRANMATLRALGAPRSMVRSIFVCEGILVSLAGGIVGIVLGSLLAVGQQYGHFIKLAGDPSQLTIAYYPVRLMPSDLLVVIALVAAVAVVTSLSTIFFTRKETPVK